MALPRYPPQFAAVLFDSNGTFMFGEDRFGPDQDCDLSDWPA
jgi:hypothetical protein